MYPNGIPSQSEGLGVSGLPWKGLAVSGLPWKGLGVSGLPWKGLGVSGLPWKGLAVSGLTWKGLVPANSPTGICPKAQGWTAERRTTLGIPR